MKKILVLSFALILVLQLCACEPNPHENVTSLVNRGGSGEFASFDVARVVDVSYNRIMKQSGLELETKEGGTSVIAIAADTVVKAGLEQLQAEESGFFVKTWGQATEHDTLGLLLFIHKLEVVEEPSNWRIER
ncbi:hypothetical protein GGQ84_001672 [Desulfitispora alkaliphila]|uniref:hypothetical protein n=1 Tax=Desulfitispora alkaliphila TaxID=622674 RepID=UPI003D19C7F7